MQATPLGRLATLVRSGAPSGQGTSLAMGDNTLTIPTGHDIVLLVPPADSTTTLVAKGDPADVGVDLVPNYPSVLTVASGDLVITAGAAVEVELLWGKTSTL